MKINLYKTITVNPVKATWNVLVVKKCNTKKGKPKQEKFNPYTSD